MTDLIEKALSANRESRQIEFKQSFDPSSPGEWCELIKDLAAIANSGGGVILFGLNNLGKPTGEIVDAIYHIDPADIANKFSKYTGPPNLDVDIRLLRKEGHHIVAFVIQSETIPIVFQKPGTYDVGSGKQRSAFSMGTIYFRHGSKSEPGTREDIRKVIESNLENIRRSWIKGVRKVVHAQPGSQVVTMAAPSKKSSTGIFSSVVRATKDPKAPAVRLTRDPSLASGSFVHEELSDGIFDEINNVIDANHALAKGQNRFFLGQPVYYRVYAERHHVHQPEGSVSLLFHSAVSEFYAPALFWALILPHSLVASTLVELYLNPKSPHIHFLLRIAVLMGAEFCEWLQRKWHDKWKRHPQPPSFYFTFQDMISKCQAIDPRVIATRASITTQIELKGEQPVSIKNLLSEPEKAAALLSIACIAVFEGDAASRTAARNLDYLAYGTELIHRGPQIAKAVMKAVGDQASGETIDQGGSQ